MQHRLNGLPIPGHNGLRDIFPGLGGGVFPSPYSASGRVAFPGFTDV